MNALFIHDHRFIYNAIDGLYYDGSGGVFSASLWKRYLTVFDGLCVVGRKGNKLPDRLVLSSAENVTFNLIDALQKDLDRLLKYKTIKNELRDIINHYDFAIIRLNSVLGYIAQSICIETGKPYLLEIVACPWDGYWNYGSLISKLIAPIELIKLKKATYCANACIYVTEQFLQKRYPTKGEFIGISNVNIKNVISKIEVYQFYRNAVKHPDDEFKIGLIGTFMVRFKGQIEGLKALKEIKVQGKIKRIKLYLVGTGDYQWVLDYAEKLNIKSDINILGVLGSGPAGIIPFLDSMHLYIHPSRQEGLPRSLIEAMSRGRITLGASTGGIPELLGEEYLHKPGDWKKLAADIAKLYEDKERWLNISYQNLNKASEYLENDLQNKREAFIQRQINKMI